MNSVVEVLTSLGQNMALVLALLFVYRCLAPGMQSLGVRAERLVFGLLFGLAACGGMLVPIELIPGMLMDSRGVLISLAAFFGGGIAAVAALIPVCLMRLALGGIGAWPGVGATICAAILGTIYYHRLGSRPEKVHHGHLAALGAAVTLLFLVWMLSLPAGSALEAVSRFALPMGITYPLGSLVLGGLVLSEIRRRQAEAARERSEAMFRQAALATNIGVWEVDLATGKLDWSENIEALFGLSPGEFEGTGAQFVGLVGPDEAARIEASVRQAVDSGGEFAVEFGMRWKQGDMHWYAASGNAVRNSQGIARTVVGVITEITERKRTQQALETTAEQLAEAQRISRTGSFEIDLVEGSITWSRELYNLLGLDPEQVRPGREVFLNAIRESDRNAWREAVDEAIMSGGSIQTQFHIDLGNREHTFAMVADTVMDHGGRPILFRGAIQDISDRVRGERRLRESEARLAESQRIARIGSWIWRDDRGFIWCSDAMYDLLGASPGGLDADFDSFLQRVHPADQDHVRACARRLVLHRETVETEWRLLKADGAVHHMFAIARPNIDAGGSVVDYRGICQDITARKCAEQALREREERYRRLVESLPICIHEIDPDGTLITINHAGLEIMGAASASELCGRPYLAYMAPHDRARIGALFARAILGEASTFEMTPELNGAPRILSSSFVPLKDEEGRVYRVMGHTVDLTDERARAADLRRLGTAIDQAVESIVITGPDAVVQYVNPAYERITGYTRAEAVGRPVSVVKSGLHDAEFYRNVWRVIAGGQTWQGEFLNRRKSGEVFHQRATISPIFGDSGEIINYVSVQHDITHEVELEKQLNRAQKMEALGTLAGGIAHDFNNILHSILGFCHIAMEAGDEDRETTSQSLQEIERGANRAAALVEQILTFSRTSGAHFNTLRLAGVVEDAVRFMRGSLPASIETEVRLDAADARVLGDPTQIHQLVTNLCTNAFHAMEERGGTLRVSLDLATLAAPLQTLSGELAPGSYALLTVEDTGIGIDPANFDKLFDPFYTTKNVGKGTGLGLSMVHGIVTRMEGRIRIDSAPNMGTRVSIYLPLSEAEAETVEAPAKNHASASRGSGSVLIVDDDESITNMVSIILRRQGFTVTVFNHPVAALEALELGHNGYDIAICDLTMPKMNGIELSRRFKALRPSMPILLATGVIDDEKLDAVQESGIVEVLRKPFRVTQLVETINRNL